MTRRAPIMVPMCVGTCSNESPGHEFCFRGFGNDAVIRTENPECIGTCRRHERCRESAEYMDNLLRRELQ